MKQSQFHAVFLSILFGQAKDYFILRVVKLLYSIAKVENYCFATYLNHYKEKLSIEMSFYDLCLLITKADDENFGIAGLQTDNTFNIGIKAFMNKEEVEITEAKFKAKSQIILETGASRNFNGCRMTIEAESIMIM